jgi:hypothetical protein
MSSTRSPDYEALFLKEAELRKHEEARRRQAEEQREQAERRSRPTTFKEFIRACQTLLSIALQVETPSRSTRGTIPPPTRKYYSTRLCLWEDYSINR